MDAEERNVKKTMGKKISFLHNQQINFHCFFLVVRLHSAGRNCNELANQTTMMTLLHLQWLKRMILINKYSEVHF